MPPLKDLREFGPDVQDISGSHEMSAGVLADGSASLVRGGLSGWQKKRLAEFIEDHLDERVRLTALAAVADLSPYHFSRAFKQSFGLPPHRYHLNRRMVRAKALLREPASSVTTVALAVGFVETSSFSSAFRKVTGITPSDYRRGDG